MSANDSLREENADLKERIGSLTAELQHLKWEKFNASESNTHSPNQRNQRNEECPSREENKEESDSVPKSLIIGDSLIKYVNKTSTTMDVISIGGAKVEDITMKLVGLHSPVPDMYIMVGTNNCDSDDFEIDDVTETFTSLLQKATECVTGNVYVIGIPPRLDKESANRNVYVLNASISHICYEQECVYVDSDPCFLLGNSQISPGFHEKDGLHINYLGTKQLLENLGLDRYLTTYIKVRHRSYKSYNSIWVCSAF